MMDWMENLWESPYELNEGEPYGTYGPMEPMEPMEVTWDEWVSEKVPIKQSLSKWVRKSLSKWV